MKEGPDIARIAALVGDPARANMLQALMTGHALTASELAQEAGVTVQTASSHLAKLETGGLIGQRKQGRHRYFRLSGDDVAEVLEALMGLAARTGHLRVRPGPKEPALRRARVCYDHLAGEMGVAMLDSLIDRGIVVGTDDALDLTPAGETFVHAFGIALDGLRGGRRPLCKACLDWSSRRNHLAGALGAAFLARFYALGWAARAAESRVVAFTKAGEAEFGKLFAAA
ncbi:MAG: winged helix-turn-helix domain-containing protein [Alphaproteobacteria bacterium]|nr:winged helix-turn-helix domain-containing protein [Alphaproteobacteria bacterium]